MNINTKEVENCDRSLSYYKLTFRRIVFHINHDPVSLGYVGFFPLSYFTRLGALLVFSCNFTQFLLMGISIGYLG